MNSLIIATKEKLEGASLNINRLIFETHLVNLKNNPDVAVKVMADEYFPLFFDYCLKSLQSLNISETQVVEHASYIYEKTIDYVNLFSKHINKNLTSFKSGGKFYIRKYLIRMLEKEAKSEKAVSLKEATNIAVNQIDEYMAYETLNVVTKYLTKDELEVFCRFYGILDKPKMTVEEMRKEFNCSFQNVYKLLNNARAKVNNMVSSLDYIHTR